MNILQEHTFFYCLLLGQFQLKLFYYGKGRQNFASNVTFYPCERSRQNHLARTLDFRYASLKQEPGEAKTTKRSFLFAGFYCTYCMKVLMRILIVVQVITEKKRHKSHRIRNL